MKRHVFEFEVELPSEWGEDVDIDQMLYRNGLKHFPYEWSVGKTISIDEI